MNQELTKQSAQHYARIYTREELMEMKNTQKDIIGTIDQKAVTIALNVYDNKYGKQLKLEF